MFFGGSTLQSFNIFSLGDIVAPSTKCPNILAMFKLVKDMPPKDKVINISFGVSSAFLLGDHLSYTANFQPTLIPAVLIGKLSAGILSIIFAYILCLPKARKLERIDRQAGIIGLDEYKKE